MDKLCFELEVKAAEDNKTNILCVTSISTPDGNNYILPDPLQPINLHVELKNAPIYTKIRNSLTRRHQRRKIWISLTAELEATYIDDGNIQFRDYLLEESIENNVIQSKAGVGITEEALTRILSTIRSENSIISKPHNLKMISEKFVLERFNGKNANAFQWLGIFKSECDRLEIIKDVDRIEILRLFLDGSCLDWYSSMLIKLTLDSEWRLWENNFSETFADKSWLSVKYAMTFKYMNGALLDYALKKEKLLLELNKSIDKQALIDLIAVGLPDVIMNRIDREKLISTEDLFNSLRSLEYLNKRKPMSEVNFNKTHVKINTELKKPCGICEKLNKKNRFHSESSCWFGNKNVHKEDDVKNVNNLKLEAKLSKEIPKN